METQALIKPLDMRSKWFSRHVAYTNAKYNMSLCTLGMAKEFENEIAGKCRTSVNCGSHETVL